MEAIPRQSTEFTMLPFKSPAHMQALDLEAMSAAKLPKYHFLYIHILRVVMTDGELHVNMQFRTIDNAIAGIKYYCLQHSVE